MAGRRCPVAPLALAAWLALPSLLGPAVAAPPAGLERLDLDALATRPAPTVDVPEERLSERLLRGDRPTEVRFLPVLRAAGGLLALWSACDRHACWGYAALLSGAPEAEVARRQVRLPVPAGVRVWAVDGLKLLPAALWDVDGDGQPELLARYDVLEPPRRGLGERTHSYLAILKLPALSIAWAHELSRGGAGDDERCEWTIERGDLDRDGRMDLRATAACRLARCQGSADPDCSVSCRVMEDHLWERRSGRYELRGGDAKRPGRPDARVCMPRPKN